MIVWAGDNTGNEIRIGGTCGDAGLYFTQDADPNAVGLGDVAAGEAFDGYGHTTYGEAPFLDPDKPGQPASRRSGHTPSGPRPSSRDRVPFAGYLFDDSAEPYLVRNRACQADLGRWLQRDPAGFVDGSNTYPYVPGNPSFGPAPAQW